MAAQLLVDLAEHALAAGIVPLDVEMSVAIPEMGLERHGPTGVVEPHAEIHHGVIHRAVGMSRGERHQVAQNAAALLILVAGIGILSP